MPKQTILPEYKTDQIVELIRQHIHNKTDRKMLYMRLVDGDTFEQIAEKLELDKKTVWRRIHKQESILFSHLPG